jgi:DNA-directed RNA polymerase subunit RPC12/RpoP
MFKVHLNVCCYNSAMEKNRPLPQMNLPGLGAARFVGGVFGFVFFGVGVTVLIFLWSAGDGFDAPPLIFRIVGSFIAIAFIAMGGSVCVTSLRGKLSGPANFANIGPQNSAASASPGYNCPRCAAALTAAAQVSPLGDVKCPQCGAWFNIHGKSG